MVIMIPAWIDGTLVPVEKLKAHQLGLRHKAVSVFVLNGQEILLQQRAKGKYHTPGLWANTCCTHPEWDEDAADCAIRRLDEELGITGHDVVFRHQLEYRADVGNDLIEHELVDVFVTQATPALHIAQNPEEVMATRWISFDELQAEIRDCPDNFTPWLRIYMSDYADVIFDPNTRAG